MHDCSKHFSTDCHANQWAALSFSDKLLCFLDLIQPAMTQPHPSSVTIWITAELQKQAQAKTDFMSVLPESQDQRSSGISCAQLWLKVVTLSASEIFWQQQWLAVVMLSTIDCSSWPPWSSHWAVLVQQGWGGSKVAKVTSHQRLSAPRSPTVSTFACTCRFPRMRSDKQSVVGETMERCCFAGVEFHWGGMFFHSMKSFPVWIFWFPS